MSIGLPLGVYAEEITENLITNVTMTTKDDVEINADKYPMNKPLLGSEVIVNYTWELENGHRYKSGDIFEFQLPEEFELYNDIDGELTTSFGSVGTYKVTKDGNAVFTFNEEIEKNSNISGTLKVWSIFSETTITGSTKQLIKFPTKTGILEIPVVFQVDSGKPIGKSGVPDNTYNASTIEWTIDVNTKLDTISNASVKDTIEEGQILVKDSIHVYALDVNLDGTATQGALASPDSITINVVDEKDIEVGFGEDINSAYRIVYQTNITNEDQQTFSNTATLFEGDKEVDSATSSVSVQRGGHLAKESTGYNAATQTVNWRIKYNYNQKSIPQNEAFLEDFLPEGHKLKQDSLNVYKVTLDANGEEEKSTTVDSAEYNLSNLTGDEPHTFTLQFKDAISSAYKIEYSTEAINPVYENGTVVNKVVTVEEEKTASRGIQQVLLIKNAQNPNYKDKTVDWKIELNGNSFEMTGLILEDSFVGNGLELIENSVKITSSTGELVKDVDYRLVPHTTFKEGFKVEFRKMINEKLVLTYKTGFDPSVSEFKNRAKISWNESEKPKEVIASFDPDLYTKSNGYKKGSYNAVTKEITWEVGVNYNLQTINKAIVEDYLLQGQTLVDGSLQVYNVSLTGGANGVERGDLLSSDDYTFDHTITKNDNPGFKLTFKNPIDSGYIITYKTSVDGQLIVDKYHNTATLFNNTDKLTDLTASVSVKHGGEYITKDALQDGKVMNWTVHINRGQSTIANTTITDTPSNNIIYLENSFVLYDTKVNEDGTVSKGTPLVKNEDYTLNFLTDEDGNDIFKLSFKDTIDSAYILEYQTYINAQNGDTVSNKVKLDGEGFTNEDNEDTKTFTVRLSGGIGTGSGETGELTVYKVDADDSEKLLPGAEFTLYDSEGKIAIKTIKTDENGQAVFSKLLYGKYILKETSAPYGYTFDISDNGREIEIDKEKVEVTITNKKLVQAVELLKFDAADLSVPLANAIFKLQKHDGTEYVDTDKIDLHTNEDGKLMVGNLEPGKYQFIETKAPFGYELDPTSIQFDILPNQTEIVTVTHSNKQYKGEVELTKVRKGNHSTTLKGAVFNLLNENGEIIIKDLTTNDEGKIVVSDLIPGKYQFVETKAPSGYRLNTAPLNFTIADDQRVILLFENDRKSSGGGGGGNNTPENPGGNTGDPGDDNTTDTPSDNEAPENPGDNNTPENPGDNNTPGKPGNNNTPENPGDNNTPGKPGNNNTPENPGDNTPGNSTSSPEIPGNNDSLGDVNGNNNTTVNNNTQNYELPNTSTNMYTLLATGITLLLLAFTMMLFNFRRES
nr:collagen binding domain-containing protein [Lysinibacillus timonensis]